MTPRACRSCGAPLGPVPPSSLCPPCCEEAGHVLAVHAHPLIARRRKDKVVLAPGTCPGRFWCERCATWLDGDRCAA